MSPTLRIVILALIGVALFFIGMAAGLMSDSDVRPPLIEYIDREVEVPVPYPVKVPGPERTIRVPTPVAVADEQIGAYRVNGYLVFHGPGRMSVHRSVMACFPLGG